MSNPYRIEPPPQPSSAHVRLVAGSRAMPARTIHDELHLFVEGTRMREARMASGLTMRWYERGDERAPVIVMLHGYPELAVSFRHQLRDLSDRFRVVVPDLRGWGGTDAPQPMWRYAMGKLVQDVADLAEHVGAPRIHLVGHDFGAAIAWEVAQRRPDLVLSLSALSCPPFGLFLRHARRQGMRSSYTWRFMLPYWWQAHVRRHALEVARETFCSFEGWEHVFSAAQLEAYASHWRRRGIPGINYYRCVMACPPLRLRPVLAPVRLIWGLADPYMSAWFSEPEHYRAFVRDIDAVHIPHAGHFVQQQAPERVSQALREHIVRSETQRAELVLARDTRSSILERRLAACAPG